jgi:xanthine dehydrogenase YagT iron-sulfur-binding subunit
MAKRKKGEDSNSDLSRRDFLRGSTAGALSGGLLSTRLKGGTAAVETGAEVLGPGSVPVTLQINGKTRRLTIEPRVTLLDALRNHLDLTGAKKVCDRGTCGSCTVILDGQPVYACSLLAIEAQGKQIRTVEGLGSPDQLAPIQGAFVDNDAQQCGFCTPGFVMACQAFLDRNPDPTFEEVEQGLGGNLCRCGTYVGIREAVKQVRRAEKGGDFHA